MGLAMPESLSHITTESQWRGLVLKADGKYWHVYMSKKTADGRNTARYPGRYLKKLPIAASRLAHYNGGASLSFRYLDHNTGETATETLTQRELVARLKQHIPEKFFKMVRYFRFLANRVCGEKLPQVYKAPGMDKPGPVAKVCYVQMVKQFLNRDPFECVLCGGGDDVPSCSRGAECVRAEEKRAGYKPAEAYPWLMQERCACNPGGV